MYADTTAELHKMADRLRLKRSWCQASGSLLHYDLTEYKRSQAVLLGAISQTREQAVQVWRELRTQTPPEGT
jgi:hypothetical protein